MVPYFTIYFRGLLSSKFIWKFGRFKETGILEWWEDTSETLADLRIKYNGSFIDHNKTEIERDKMKSDIGATLDGNIIMVFAVLGGGLGIAVICFLVEKILHPILKRILLSLLKLCLANIAVK